MPDMGLDAGMDAGPDAGGGSGEPAPPATVPILTAATGSIVVRATITGAADAAALTLTQGALALGPLPLAVAADANGADTDVGVVVPASQAAGFAAGPVTLTVQPSLAGVGLPPQTLTGTLTPADPRTVAVLQLAAGRLQRQPEDLDPNVFTPELTFLRTELSSKFPCIGDPATLTGNDAVFFDRATGLLLAARLFAATVQGEGGNVLTQTTADGTREQFAALDPALPQAWAKEAMTAVSRVSCIRASYQGPSSSFTVFGAFGRSRALEARCGGGLLGFGLSLLDLAMFPLNFEFPLSSYVGTGGYSPDYFAPLDGTF